MLDFTQAVYDRMVNDITLTDLLGTFESIPCIFTDSLVPEEAPRPYIWSSGDVSVQPDDDKLGLGYDVIRDITAIVDRGQTAIVEQIARRLYVLFHRHEVTISGGTTWMAQASGPVKAETDKTVEGLIVTVRLRVNDI